MSLTRTCALIVTASPLEAYIWWVSAGYGKKLSSWWCAASGGQYDWRLRTGSLVIQDSTDPRDAKVFWAHAAPQGTCENWINGLEALDKPAEGCATVRLRQESQFCWREVAAGSWTDGPRKFTLRRQPGSSESWRLAPGNKVKECGDAKVRAPLNFYQRKVRMHSLCEHVRKVCCAPSVDTSIVGDQRWQLLAIRRSTGTLFATSFSTGSRRTRVGNHVLFL